MIYAVIDTNVIVSAYITKNLRAATSKVWEAVLQGKIIMKCYIVKNSVSLSMLVTGTGAWVYPESVPATTRAILVILVIIVISH